MTGKILREKRNSMNLTMKQLGDKVKLSPVTISDLENGKSDLISDQALQLAMTIDEEVKDSREKSLAMTKLEECISWINKALIEQDGELYD